MQAPHVDTPITDHCATIYVAVELSLKSWLVVLYRPDRDRLSRHKLATNDADGLVDLIWRVRDQVAVRIGRPATVATCYEASYDGFWLHRRLAAAGIENLVIDPSSLTVERRARRAKTDRIDGERMVRALMAHRRGEPRVLRAVRVPSPDQEDARRQTRERERLIKEQTAHLNRLKGLLRTLGLAAGQPGRRDWPERLSELRDWQGAPVPPHLRAELEREHARLMLVHAQIRALAAQSVAPETAVRARQLSQLRGIGPVFATTLANELWWKNFRNRREVAAYCGLTPTPWQSGDTAYDQGISKAGNRRARTVAVELAWLWLRHQPDSALSRWFHAQVAARGGRGRRIAIVALARKLVIALWRFLTTGLVPSDAVLKA